jgi:hypothetical protein
LVESEIKAVFIDRMKTSNIFFKIVKNPPC